MGALLLMAPAPAVDTSTSSQKKKTTTTKKKTTKKKTKKTTKMMTMMTKTTMKMKIRTNRFFTELAESFFIFLECGSLINATFNCGIICIYLFRYADGCPNNNILHCELAFFLNDRIIAPP